jgi:hypothetical protein
VEFLDLPLPDRDRLREIIAKPTPAWPPLTL